jgi:hypothetical protein
MDREFDQWAAGAIKYRGRLLLAVATVSSLVTGVMGVTGWKMIGPSYEIQREVVASKATLDTIGHKVKNLEAARDSAREQAKWQNYILCALYTEKKPAAFNPPICESSSH